MPEVAELEFGSELTTSARSQKPPVCPRYLASLSFSSCDKDFFHHYHTDLKKKSFGKKLANLKRSTNTNEVEDGKGEGYQEVEEVEEDEVASSQDEEEAEVGLESLDGDAHPPGGLLHLPLDLHLLGRAGVEVEQVGGELPGKDGARLDN